MVQLWWERPLGEWRRVGRGWVVHENCVGGDGVPCLRGMSEVVQVEGLLEVVRLRRMFQRRKRRRVHKGEWLPQGVGEL